MKPAPFEYTRPATLDQAVRLLAGEPGAARVLAGGQSLGPMLNLRLAQPDRIVDVRRIPALTAVSETAGGIELGACVTHAMIEDGDVPDVTRGLMPRVAGDIAYRAIRNRGTIGGSLCHADPAADWVTVLALLGATLCIVGPHGTRTVAIGEFMIGAYSTVIAEDELLTGIRIPRVRADARWVYRKVCRKPGEFADAMVGALTADADPRLRVAIGAIDRTPLVIDDARDMLLPFDREYASRTLAAAGLEPDSYRHRVCLATLRRVAAEITGTVA